VSGPLVEAEYFKNTCISIFSDLLNELGYTYYNNKKIIGVRYVKENYFFEISYYPEDFPNYIPIITVGYYEDNSKFIDGIRRATNIWNFIPITNQIDVACKNTFSNQHELEKLLIISMNQYVKIYLVPILKDTQLIKNQIDENDQENKKQDYLNNISILKQQAGKSLFARKYKDVLKTYSKIDPSELSANDKKRIELAIKYLKNKS
jgi:hypothetical protein